MATAFEMDTGPDDMAEAPAAARPSPIDTLRMIMASDNLAEDIAEDVLAKLAHRVVSEHKIDKESRKEWEERTKQAMELAMLVAKEKDYPFKNAANVKFPLLTVAALQFNARAYPAIVSGSSVVKCKTWGADAQGLKAARAKRVADFMSYQLLSKLPEWEEDTDRILVMLPIVGCVFRKVYYDPALKRTCTRLVTADRLVVNYHARSLIETPRVTEELSLYPYEIEERIRSGRFVKFDYGNAVADEDAEDKGAHDGDDDSPHAFLEQHRLYDLDGDGYPEPYVVTVHKSSSTVVRVVANFEAQSVTFNDSGIVSIRRRDYYVKYPFMPSPDGGFYDWGFGWLLKDIGESINGTLNQMLDAGHLANTQGGLVSAALGLREKSIRLQPGEWKTVNTSAKMGDAVLPITYPGPSPVLFNLLGLLIESGREVANIKDVLTGEQNSTAPATTTLALIEQGMQMFNAIYKRVHRAVKRELEMHAEINAKHMEPQEYASFFDEPEPVQGQAPVVIDPKADFNLRDMDIMPISDPQIASRTQELARANFLREWAAENPLANQPEVNKRILEAAQIEDVDKLISVPQPDPLEDIMKKLLLRNAVLDVHAKEAGIEKTDKETTRVEAGTIADLAGAQAKLEGSTLDRMKAMADMLARDRELRQKEAELGTGRPEGMAGSPGNAMGAGGGAGPNGGGAPAMPGAAIPVGNALPGGLGIPTGSGGLPEGGL